MSHRICNLVRHGIKAPLSLGLVLAVSGPAWALQGSQTAQAGLVVSAPETVSRPATLPATGFHEGVIRLSRATGPGFLSQKPLYPEGPSLAMVNDGSAIILSEKDEALFVADFAEGTPSLNMTQYTLCRNIALAERGDCTDHTDLYKRGNWMRGTAVKNIEVGHDRTLNAIMQVSFLPASFENEGYFRLTPVQPETGAIVPQAMSALAGSYSKWLSEARGRYRQTPYKTSETMTVNITDSGQLSGRFNYYSTAEIERIQKPGRDRQWNCRFNAQLEPTVPASNVWQVRNFLNQCSYDNKWSAPLTGMAHLRQTADGGSELIVAVVNGDSAFYFRIPRML